MEYLQIFLIAIIFLSIVLELKTGIIGFGILLSIFASLIFWYTSFQQGFIELYQIGLFFLGVILFVMEILTPTIGILGLIGLFMIFYSFILAMGGDIQAIYFLCFAIFISVVLFFFIGKYFPTSTLWHKIILKKSSSKEAGYNASTNYDDLIGKNGVVYTELRPSGTAFIDGRRYDVISQGEYIKKDAQIKVISSNGNRIIVMETSKED